MQPEDIYSELEKGMQKVQKELTANLEKEITKLEVDEYGNIKYSEKNITIIYGVEKIVEDYGFGKKPIFKKFVNDMLRMIDGISKDYTTSESQMAEIKKRTEATFYKMGIDKQGNVIKGTFFDELATQTKVAQEIADFFLKGVTQGLAVDELTTQIKGFVSGKKNVNGVMERYIRTNVHDIIWNTNASINKNFADTLNLNYFVYDGSIIEKTREFCEQRSNRVFHVNDVASFPKDKEYFPPNYDFFIHRGGYNCRHKIRYISNELGAKLWGQEI